MKGKNDRNAEHKRIGKRRELVSTVEREKTPSGILAKSAPAPYRRR